MRSACGSWVAQWMTHAVGPAPARRTQDLVANIDYTMEKKHELGICKDLSFEECLQYKSAKYPEIYQNVSRVVGQISTDASVRGKGPQGAPPATVNGEVLGTTTKQIVAEWTDFHKTLNLSGHPSHLPWAIVGLAAGIGAGALLVARATSGLRQRYD